MCLIKDPDWTTQQQLLKLLYNQTSTSTTPERPCSKTHNKLIRCLCNICQIIYLWTLGKIKWITTECEEWTAEKATEHLTTRARCRWWVRLLSKVQFKEVCSESWSIKNSHSQQVTLHLDALKEANHITKQMESVRTMVPRLFQPILRFLLLLEPARKWRMNSNLVSNLVDLMQKLSLKNTLIENQVLVHTKTWLQLTSTCQVKEWAKKDTLTALFQSQTGSRYQQTNRRVTPQYSLDQALMIQCQ